MNEVLKAIKSRRSVRKYSDRQIDKETLGLIIEAGIFAPSAHNDQPWHFTVIQNRALIDSISRRTKEILSKSDVQWMREFGKNPNIHLSYHAPVLIVVSGRKNAVAPETDCNAAIENMLIAAESLGVGSVWLGLIRAFFTDKDEAAKLQIPEGYEPYYGVAMGYSANEKPLPAPRRNPDVVTYIV